MGRDIRIIRTCKGEGPVESNDTQQHNFIGWLFIKPVCVQRVNSAIGLNQLTAHFVVSVARFIRYTLPGMTTKLGRPSVTLLGLELFDLFYMEVKIDDNRKSANPRERD